MNIGTQILKIRKEKALTQEEYADCGIISPDYDPMEVPISWK